MKSVTRVRPQIDRMACPWLIARRLDTEPEFLYVPEPQLEGLIGANGQRVFPDFDRLCPMVE